ncbi:hypothetical protein JCM10450v2_002974 [Rhodotorula kratochvilovae]
MAALRISPPTKPQWAPLMSPVSASSPSSITSTDDSLSARCRLLASRLGESAVHDEGFDTAAAPPLATPPGSRRASTSSPSPGRSPRVAPSNPPPSFPLSPRASMLAFDAPPQHLLDGIREEDDGDSTPKVEADMTSAWAPPRLAVPGQADGAPSAVPLVSPGTPTVPLPGGGGSAEDDGFFPPGSPASSYGAPFRRTVSSSSAARRASLANSIGLSLQQEEQDDHDMEEATIEEQEVEMRQLLKEGATWLGVDVWLVDGELLVASKESALDPSHTFSAVIVGPLLRIFSPPDAPPTTSRRRRSSVFSHVKPQTPFQLVLRLRTPASITFPFVVSDLAPLQDASLLTTYCPNGGATTPGLITVVSSSANGAEMVPLEELTVVQGPRCVFRDAPVAAFDGEDGAATADIDPAVTPVAAGALVEATGWDGQKPLTAEQRERIARQVERAHARGLKVRYEALPNFPIHVREQCRQTLAALDVDYL